MSDANEVPDYATRRKLAEKVQEWAVAYQKLVDYVLAVSPDAAKLIQKHVATNRPEAVE